MTHEEYMSIVKLAKKKVQKYIDLHEKANYIPGILRKEDDFGYWLAVSAQEALRDKLAQEKQDKEDLNDPFPL